MFATALKAVGGYLNCIYSYDGIGRLNRLICRRQFMKNCVCIDSILFRVIIICWALDILQMRQNLFNKVHTLSYFVLIKTKHTQRGVLKIVFLLCLLIETQNIGLLFNMVLSSVTWIYYLYDIYNITYHEIVEEQYHFLSVSFRLLYFSLILHQSILKLMPKNVFFSLQYF